MGVVYRCEDMKFSWMYCRANASDT
jgi:hypothetical protein